MPGLPGGSLDSLAEPMRSRWSPRVFDDQHEVTPAEIESLLAAARWAPSAGNSQPWSFVVASRGSQAHALLIETLSRGNSWWVPRASLVFVAIAQVRTGEEPDAPVFSDYATYDVGQAAAHVTLQAQAMGLFAHQFAGFDHDALGQAYAVPATHRVLTGIAVGKRGNPEDVDPADVRNAERDPLTRSRKPLADFAFTETWGRPWEC